MEPPTGSIAERRRWSPLFFWQSIPLPCGHTGIRPLCLTECITTLFQPSIRWGTNPFRWLQSPSQCIFFIPRHLPEMFRLYIWKGERPCNGRYKTDRKSTRLNSSHVASSYAVFCLKKKMNENATKSEATTVNSKLRLIEEQEDLEMTDIHA